MTRQYEEADCKIMFRAGVDPSMGPAGKPSKVCTPRHMILRSASAYLHGVTPTIRKSRWPLDLRTRLSAGFDRLLSVVSVRSGEPKSPRLDT